MRRLLARWFFVVVPVLTATVGALAKGAEHGAGGGHAEVKNWWGVGAAYAESPALGLLSITFFAFLGVLVVALKKPLALYLENRADTVKKAIEEAKRARDAAEARARDAEAKLAALGGEVLRLKADFEAQGKAEAERLEKLAHDAAARIAKDAEDTIAAEAQRAQLVLRQEAARLALELAEERIKGALTDADEVRLHKSLVDELRA
ncbi:MAG: ATP synthase F0 subunit B [Deltaproteobacteria bacterium]|nr:ATP synthase F0 subunit B [Deltaproteobacteria bacterium]